MRSAQAKHGTGNRAGKRVEISTKGKVGNKLMVGCPAPHPSQCRLYSNFGCKSYFSRYKSRIYSFASLLIKLSVVNILSNEVYLLSSKLASGTAIVNDFVLVAAAYFQLFPWC
jgi:hypothetical protein